ncbi:MAG: glycosyltransferase [Sneathiella sp.]|nr:glycosyltransferase [Sneathiella sp.]
MHPYLSVVIPVYNEEAGLDILFSRLLPVLDGLGRSFEVICVNDGSADNSQAILEKYCQTRPDVIRALSFSRNCGQHTAIMAGFEAMRGELAITMDADLQNPPEDIPKLIELVDQGHDVVGGFRSNRDDPAYRRAISKLSNIFREYTTQIHMRDHGCMLRAYRRDIIEQIIKAGDSSPFITAFSQYLAQNPAEVQVGHEARAAGESNYNLYKLIRYNFDLITGFSVVPLQLFTIFGMAMSFFSGLLVVYMVMRRLIIGPEVDGVFTLFAILFFLISVLMTGLGLIGEYVGRIYKEVRSHPRFIATEFKPELQDKANES